MDESKFTSDRVLKWGGGVFALFALAAVLLTAGPIASDAARRAGEILQLEGHDWATVERFGRGVEIGGTAPSEEGGEAALRAVEADWAVRRVWAAYDVAPPAPPEPESEKSSATTGGRLQASGAIIGDWRVCQSLVDAVMDGGHIAFVDGAAEIDAVSHDHLDRIAGALMRCETVWINVGGLTGDDAASRQAGLADARAQAVLDYLVWRGVPAERTIAKSEGLGDAGAEKDRSIQVRVVGIGDME